MIVSETKNDINILEGRVVLELLIKTRKILFSSITQELFSLLKFQCHFKVSLTIFFWMFK